MVAIAVVAPTPIATVRTAAIVNAPFLVRVRIEIRTSFHKPMQPAPAGLDTILPLLVRCRTGTPVGAASKHGSKASCPGVCRPTGGRSQSQEGRTPAGKG